MWKGKVQRQFEAGHSNGPPGQKCYTMHGHSWQVELEWTYNELDQYGWGPNFADVKKIIDAFDHQNLNEMFDHASAEIVAQNIALRFSVMFRFAPDYVQIQEGSGNTVRWVPK